LAQELVVGKLDHSSRRVLDWIYLRCREDRPLYTLEVMTESGLASLATTYNSLRNLIDLNLIELTVQANSEGRRAIKLTQLAAKELNTLGVAFREWMVGRSG
jgi:hypothetical protein